MAGKIKGITIEIGGNTQPLNKALEEVNRKSRDIQKELKQVDRLLKFNPGNTELLAQKQKLLGDQVKATKEKLDTLRAAQAQVTEQFKKGEIGEEQYRAFQRELVKTESQLKHFEQQLKSTGMTAEQLGKKLQGAGQKMTDAGKDLSMKVTAPIVGLGAVITKTGMDFEAAMSEVGAISGATGEDLQALEDIAKEMGSTTKFSASEAADGLKFMAMAGWDTQKMLDGLPGVLNLAAAAGEDLGLVSDIVTDAMTAFGMEAARAGEFADTIAAASSSANTNVAMLGESFKYVAPLAGALGYEAKDTAIALAVMANAGIKGSQSGTALRAIFTRLAKPTKESGTAMDKLGLSITNTDGSMKTLAEMMDDLREAFKDLNPEQQAVYAAQIAGQEAMSGLLAIVNTGDDDFNKLSESINNSTGAADRMAKEMQDNLLGRLTELKSAIEGVALQLYEAMLPALEKVVAAVQTFVDWLAKLSPGMKTTIVVIAGLAAAIGPLLIVLGLMAQGIGAVIGVAGVLSGVFSALSGAVPVLGAALGVITAPVALVIAAIAALVMAGVALYKNWDDIVAFSAKLWEALKKGWTEGMASMKKALSDFGKQISESWTKLWGGIKDFFDQWGRTILLLAVGPAGWAVLLAQKLGVNWESIRSTTSRVWEGIKNAIVSPIESAKQTLFGIIDTIKNAFANMRIEIPRPKLPHINVDWRSVGVGDAKVRIPKFAVDWYDKGGVFTNPAIIGVAEKRPEFVGALDDLRQIIRDELRGTQLAAAGAGNGGGVIVQQMIVRNDHDIELIARKLHDLQQDKARGRGLR
ncbi:phage tail tape measure protein [Syntrophomonas erecta subsp. sporosyntropha]